MNEGIENWDSGHKHEEPEKEKDVRTMPDGSMQDFTGKSPEEIKEALDAYRDNK